MGLNGLRLAVEARRADGGFRFSSHAAAHGHFRAIDAGLRPEVSCPPGKARLRRHFSTTRQFQLRTTLPDFPDSIRSNPFWNSSIGNWWLNTLPSGKPDSTS
jgi:hypothetical protein